MKRWRRPLILIALLLLVGAVVNVAVAWSAATLWQGEGQLDEPESPPRWFVLCTNKEMRRGNSRERLPMLFHNRSVAIASAQRFDQLVGSSELYGQETLAAGFPWLALRAVWPPEGAEVSAIKRGLPVGVVRVRDVRLLQYFRGRLPIDPVLPGFLLNTLFYAAILALPLGFFPIRRRLRARRGRCPGCGYDRTGFSDLAAPCPECGQIPPPL